MNKFWKWVRNKAPDSDPDLAERTLFLDGSIGGDDTWFEDSVTPAAFKEDLDSGKGPITVWINSPGGDVWAAAQIYNMLLSYSGKITVKIDGLAASAASVIAMAGDEVLVSPVSLLMVHNPSTMAMGDKDDLAQAISMLDSVKDSILNAYVKKTGLSKNKLSKLMDDETWMDANKAVELHFADRVMERPDLYHEDEQDKKIPEEPEQEDGTVPGGDRPKKDTSGEGPDKNGTSKDHDKIGTGFLYSSRQMAAAFTNKVKKHYEVSNTAQDGPVAGDNAEGGRSVDALMDRLNLLHTMM